MEIAWDQAGLATPMADGDLVRVLLDYAALSEDGHGARKHRQSRALRLAQGMHVSDLIPDKDSLITRNYWWKRAQMGLPGPEFEPLQHLPHSSPADDGYRIAAAPPDSSHKPAMRPGTSGNASADGTSE